MARLVSQCAAVIGEAAKIKVERNIELAAISGRRPRIRPHHPIMAAEIITKSPHGENHPLASANIMRGESLLCNLSLITRPLTIRQYRRSIGIRNRREAAAALTRHIANQRSVRNAEMSQRAYVRAR